MLKNEMCMSSIYFIYIYIITRIVLCYIHNNYVFIMYYVTIHFLLLLYYDISLFIHTHIICDIYILDII